MDRCDLHTHSTASDGTARPAEVMRLAKKAGLRAVALTDHDTLDGLPEAAAEAAALDLELIPGCEISLDGVPGTFHMVGLGIDPDNATLRARLDVVRTAREGRNAGVLARLNELGIEMTMEEVAAEAGGDVIGRPHFARVLINKGAVKDFGEAFQRYLGKGQAAYVDRTRLSMEDAIDAIHGAGGVAVLAHPYTVGFGNDTEVEEWLGRMAAMGLDGLETVYTEHSGKQTRKYREMATRLGLLESGGSDFHGDNKKGTHVGTGKGSLAIPYALWEALRERAAARGNADS